MKSIKFTRKNIIALGGFSIIGMIFTALILITDSLLLSFLFKHRNYHLNQGVGILLNAKNNPEINKSNIGKFLKEGIMLDEPKTRGAHHDKQADYSIKSNGKKIVWLLGDSWGEGLKINEIENQTIAKNLNYNFSKLRFIVNGSWSPVLMNIARKHRSKIYNEVPDTVILFIDQTDIGDDYCRHRPWVERDNDNKIYKVYRNEYTSQSPNRIWGLRLLLENEKSGIIFALKKFISILFFNSGHGVSGLTSCPYKDLMAWQLGKIYSSNGSPTYEYKKYIKENINEFINELRVINPEINFLLVTHNWAQHEFNGNRKGKFKKNISSITSEVSSNFLNVDNLHLASDDYPNSINNKSIYKYPNDIYSHLKNYEFLALKISEKLIKINF